MCVCGCVFIGSFQEAETLHDVMFLLREIAVLDSDCDVRERLTVAERNATERLPSLIRTVTLERETERQRERESERERV